MQKGEDFSKHFHNICSCTSLRKPHQKIFFKHLGFMMNNFQGASTVSLPPIPVPVLSLLENVREKQVKRERKGAEGNRD